MSTAVLARVEGATGMSVAEVRQAMNVSRQVGRVENGAKLLAYLPGA
jgi:hypothetical protein